MTTLAPLPIQSFKDSNGNPLAGGLLYTYAAGTSTAQSTYLDSTGVSANTNPIVLNSRGEAAIWLTSGLAYKFILQDASANLIWSVDQITNPVLGGNPISLASAGTTDIGGQNSSAIEVSGTTAITSLGTNYNGPRFVRFTGALTLIYSLPAINLPGAASITTAAGDVAIFYPNLALNGWNLMAYTKAASLAALAGALASSGITGAAASGANSDITSLSSVTSVNGGQLAGLRNRIINGNFNINQRAVSGTVTLAAGAYGHDRFKAGAGGCTYTFAASANGNMLTISAGTLQQVIEGANLEGGAMKLSWFGTATGRVDTGAYGASGVVGTAIANTNQTIEFGVGTLARAQYEFGSILTTLEQRPIGLELALCQRYFCVGTLYYEGYTTAGSGSGGSSNNFPVSMRAAPTVTFPVFTNIQNSSVGANRLATTAAIFRYCIATATALTTAYETYAASAEL